MNNIGIVAIYVTLMLLAGLLCQLDMNAEMKAQVESSNVANAMDGHNPNDQEVVITIYYYKPARLIEWIA